MKVKAKHNEFEEEISRDIHKRTCTYSVLPRVLKSGGGGPPHFKNLGGATFQKFFWYTIENAVFCLYNELLALFCCFCACLERF